jgi:hypothetical protein
MNMKVWSNFNRPVTLLEPKYNCVDTNFCTEKRHQKCVSLGICQAQQPRCGMDSRRMAKMKDDTYFDAIDKGNIDQIVAVRKKMDREIAIVLGALLERCRPYILSWERVKNAVQARKKSCLPRKKRCRPSKK